MSAEKDVTSQPATSSGERVKPPACAPTPAAIAAKLGGNRQPFVKSEPAYFHEAPFSRLREEPA